MRHYGKRFVPQSTIDRRVQAKDDRIARELRARVLRPDVIPFAEVVIVPAAPSWPDCPTCDGYAFDGHVCPGLIDSDERIGECSSACGFCGRCS